MTVEKTLKVAVIVNSGEHSLDRVKYAFTTVISKVSISPKIDFYDPIAAQIYPDVEAYDVIILSGGRADPMSKDLPWVLKEQEFIRETVKNFPRKKILGFCWGHQTIAITFDGIVSQMEKAEIGVHTIGLNEKGTAFFPEFLSNSSYDVMEFHAREITKPGKGFVPLAEHNQCFVNAANTVMTFQGHPEMGSDVAQTLLANAPDYMKLNDSMTEELKARIEKPADGVAIWRRLVRWIEE